MMSLSKKIGALLILWSLFNASLQAQSSKEKTKFVSISGYIEDGSTDSVEIYFNPTIERNILNLDFLTFLAIPNENGVFHINLPAISQAVKVLLLLRSGDSHSGRYGNIKVLGDGYLIEPGDSIYMTIRKQGEEFKVDFSGRGSAKYKCRQAIDVTIKSVLSKIEDKRKDSNFYNLSTLNETCKQCDSITALKILDHYKSKLSYSVYQIMKADIVGKIRESGCLLDLYRFYLRANDDQKEKLVELYKRFFGKKSNPVPDKIIILSQAYLNYLMSKSQFDLIFSNQSDNVTNFYKKIKGDYNGIVREYLLVKALQGRSNQVYNDNIDSLWKDVLKFIHTGSLKNFVERQVIRKLKGSAAFNFSLESISGNKITLNSLKGKVVLIDFWFTGCMGCLAYGQRLENYVYPEFKDNPDVVFVSISGDKNKEQWLLSVKEGRYTKPEYINLYTNGLGFNHPLTKYYDINGGPNSLLIGKDGKSYSGNPPKNDMKALITLLREALVQNN